jgi:hypothetical protein
MPKIPSLIPFLKSKVPVAVGFIIFLLFAAGFIFADKSLRINDIQLVSKENKEHPVGGFTSFESKSILLFDTKEAEQVIKESNSYIKDVTITKQYPNTLLVKFQYYSPRAYLKMQEGYLLLSDEGMILEKTREEPNSKLPAITYYQNLSFSGYQAGREIGLKDIEDSIYYLQKLNSLKVTVNSIDIASFHMLGLYTDTETYYFSSEKDRTEQAYQLEAAMREFRISGTKFKSLDVRFDKPVVVMAETN